MKICALAILAIALAFAVPPAATAQDLELAPSRVEGRIVEIRVHGNHTTPDADVLAIAGLKLGDPATPERIAEAESRLLASRRFTTVEVRRRYQSIPDPSRILIVLLVDELRGVSKQHLIPGPMARLGH